MVEVEQAEELVLSHLFGVIVGYATQLQQCGGALSFPRYMLAPTHGISYTLPVMKVNEQSTVQVSFRLERQLVERMREVTSTREWPPPPSQTEIVARGIELVLAKLKGKRTRSRAEV